MNYNSTTIIERSKVAGAAQIFEVQAGLTPDAIAVRCEQQQLTYRELNAKANQLANYLKTCGIEPDVRVGICAERSLEMVIGILGILKAGGAYVPLDPAYPQERLSFILQETQVSLLLTQSHLVEALPQQATQVLCLDIDWEIIDRQSDQNPDIEVKPENLAYVMYTSGSTGKPKGVQITHANVWHYIWAISKILDVNAEDVYLHTASFSFSSSVRQLLVPLSQGATCIIATREQTKNPLNLFELIQKQNVTVSDTVPSVWRYGLQALATLDPARVEALTPSKLRTIVLSGEITPCQLLQKIRSKLKNHPRFFNVYGQTETIGNCAYPIPEEFDREQGYVPVGYPYAHNQAYILNDELQGVAVGEIGELHMAGACLTRGYLNRPELNAEKFISNPFAGNPSIPSNASSRLFKTGDLARWLPDGAIEIVGRTDFQVKIRGMRVEIGEIEALLEQHPAVKETAVAASEDAPGDKRLVAYLVAHSPATDESNLRDELRSFLTDKLPDYMVPSSFVMLKALPLTPNGKLDRKALPALNSSRTGSERRIVFPRNGLERLLKEVWERVLDVKPISIKDNFFDLGGHSLVAVRLLSEIENICGKSLPLATLLQAPTVEKLAKILESEGGTTPAQSLVALNRASGKPPLFCIYGMLLYRDLARYFDADWPVYGVYLDAEIELLKAGKLEAQMSSLTSVADVASQYLKEIRTLQPAGPYYLAGESFGGLVAFEMAQQLRAAGEQVELVALFDTRFPGQTPEMSLQKRLSLHLERLRQEGFSYVLEKVEKVARKLKSSKGKLVRIAGKLSGNSKQSNTQPEFNESEEMATDVRIAVRERAIENYSPQPYPGKLVLFRAMDRTAFEKYYTDPKLWRSLTIDGLEVHEISGDHLGILKEPYVKVLADKLKGYLKSPQPVDVSQQPVEVIRS